MQFVRYFALICSSIFYGYQYIIRVLPSVISDVLKYDFCLSDSALGQFSGIYYIGYTLSHIPFGILIDRIGLKIVLVTSVILSFLGLIPILFSDSWTMILLGRFLSGFGSSGAILAMLKVLNVYFSSSFSKLLGIAATFGLSCAVFGGKPLVLLMQHVGIDKLIGLIIIFGLCLSLLCIMIQDTDKTSLKNSMVKDLKNVVFNKNIAILCFFGGLMMGPLEGFADMWGVEFFMKFYRINKADAAFLGSLIFLGMGLGGPLVGYVTDKFGNFNRIIAICGSVITLSFTALFFKINSLLIVGVLMLLSGIASAYQIPLITSTLAHAKKSSLGAAYTNMVVMMFGYVFHTLISGIAEATNSMGDVASAVISISSIPILSFIGCMGFFLIKNEKNSEFDKSH
ncbi:MFS transporter [Candidatus Gromoviella agglomerans]|uniref:MFS transporter n=1 Tax=Candidatus Gromoviella agglomerans TaxID=2806609 RepID=UPI001E58929F|nr:MFS transporter [Candidatus Gromoviella agglomerans]UFX98529.1 MFS transporter [Candidatus Gromoviella agglomerans]